MAKYQIEIDIGNAAFDDAPGAEVARILRGFAGEVEHVESQGGEIRLRDLRDINGNKVGTARKIGR